MAGTNDPPRTTATPSVVRSPAYRIEPTVAFIGATRWASLKLPSVAAHSATCSGKKISCTAEYTATSTAAHAPARRVEGTASMPTASTTGVSLMHAATASSTPATRGRWAATAMAATQHAIISGVVCPTTLAITSGTVNHTNTVPMDSTGSTSVRCVQNL